jgi:hypothetical protein
MTVLPPDDVRRLQSVVAELEELQQLLETARER